MRLANSSHPYFSCNSMMIRSRVIPCSGSLAMNEKKGAANLVQILRLLLDYLLNLDIESIQIHHLVPSGNKVMNKLGFC